MQAHLSKAVAAAIQPFRSVSWKNRILIAIFLGATSSVLLIYTSAPKPAVLVAEEETWPVTTIPANPGPVSPEITLYGRVETPRTALLTSSVSAHVRAVPVLEGQLVSKDEALVLLDNTDAQLVVDRYRANAQEAKADLESLRLKDIDNRKILEHEKELYELSQQKVQRHEKLRSNSSISEEILNSVLRESHLQAISLQVKTGLVKDFENRLARSQAGVQRAQALLKEAQVQLSRTEIRAPFDGKVTKVYLAQGERVSIGTNLVEIYDTAALEIRAQIPSSVLPKLQQALGRSDQVDLQATVNIDNMVLKACLARLSGKVTAGHSGVDGLFRVLENSENLVLGRAVNLTLQLPKEADVVAVPIQAIYGENRVYLVTEEDRLQGITIERLGDFADSKGHFQVLVRAPQLTSGAQIVTTQLSNAISGLRVSINNDQPVIAAENSHSVGKSTGNIL